MSALSMQYKACKKAVTQLKDTKQIDGISKQLEKVPEAAKAAHAPKMAMKYVDGLMKLSEQWISAFVDRYCHIGISTTGRVEASHSSFKRDWDCNQSTTVFTACDNKD